MLNSAINKLQLYDDAITLNINGTIYKSGDNYDTWHRQFEYRGSGYDENIYAINDILFLVDDPLDKKIKYRLRSSGLEKWAGQSWVNIMNGLPNSVNKIAISSKNNNEIYAATSNGLYKTTDGGFAWEPTNLRGNITQLIVSDDKMFAVASSQPFKSENSGKSWEKISANLPTFSVKGQGRTATVVNADVSNLVLVNAKTPFLLCFIEKYGIYRSDDNGKSWHAFNNGFDTSDGMYSYSEKDGSLIIGAYGNLYSLNSENTRFEKIIDDKDKVYYFDAVNALIKANDGGYIFGDSSNRLFHYKATKGLTALNDGVLSHSDVFMVKNIKIGNENRLFVYANNNSYIAYNKYGVYYSTDNGLTWKPSVRLDRSYDNITFRASPHQSGHIIMFPERSNKGYVSYDAGTSWSFQNLTRDPTNDYNNCYYFDPTENNVVFNCSGINGSWLYKLKGQLGTGSQWTALNQNAHTYDIKIDNSNSKRIIAYGSDNRITIDGGWTWNIIGVGGKPLYFNKDKVIFFTKNGIELFNDKFESIKTLKKLSGYNILNFVINPDNENNIIIAYQQISESNSYNTNENEVVVSQSNDFGSSWKPVAFYKPLPYRGVQAEPVSIDVAKVNDVKNIYFGCRHGLFITADEGMNWKLIGGVLASDKIGNNKSRFKSAKEQESVDITVKLDNDKIKNYLNYDFKLNFDMDVETGKYREDTVKSVKFNSKAKVIINKDGSIKTLEVNTDKYSLPIGLGNDAYWDKYVDKVTSYLDNVKMSPVNINDQIVSIEGTINIPTEATINYISSYAKKQRQYKQKR
jgi:photosystem II stability/assembly factor-like uncharacterized protein